MSRTSIRGALLAAAVLAFGAAREAAGQAARDSAALLDPNVATDAQLMAVPGLSHALAQRIVRARPLRSILALDSVLADSLTPEQRTAVYRRVFVPIDLNTASDAEILKIPGLGRRMLREFKEYRPYGDMERFRREIGKYVDAQEVARLERYVTIR